MSYRPGGSEFILRRVKDAWSDSVWIETIIEDLKVQILLPIHHESEHLEGGPVLLMHVGMYSTYVIGNAIRRTQ